MKNIKMKYKDFEFPTNPATLEISSKQNISVTDVYGSKGVAENVSAIPTVITGSGVFYGEKAHEHCTYLARLLKDSDSGWLHCPTAYPVKAFFADFVYKVNSEKSCISYSFRFIEDCNETKTEKKLYYTYVLDGENCFDIAYRENVSVNDIMRLNDLKTPFDIVQGERMKIR